MKGVGAASLVTVICGILAIALLLYAALHDLAARTVPNWLPLCVLALGIVARLMDHALANSLIMKLYYFDGQGLQYFKPLILSKDLTGRTRIKVFQVIY